MRAKHVVNQLLRLLGNFLDLVMYRTCSLVFTAILKVGKDLLRADIGRHDQDGVLEIHGPPLRIGDAAVIQYLQQYVEHIGVCFLDLVEEHDRVRFSADCLGQLTALFVADVSRRRSDQSGHGVFLHVLGHVDPDHVLLVVKKCLRQCFGQLGLTDTGGTQEQEGTDRLGGILDARLAAHDGFRNLGHRLVLTDDPLMQLVVQMQCLVPLRLSQLADRNACPARNNLCDFFFRHLLLHQGKIVIRQILLQFLQLLLKLRHLAVEKFGSFIQIAALLCHLDLTLGGLDLFTQLRALVYLGFLVLPSRLSVVKALLQVSQFFLQLLKALLAQVVLFLLQAADFHLGLNLLTVQLIQLGRHGSHFGLDQCTGLIHQVDRLIGQETVRDITVRQNRRRHQGVVKDFDPVINLVALLQAAQDRDRVFHGRLVHHDRLETPLEGCVLLDVLAVLVQRRRTDTVQLAAGQHGLEHVAGIQRAVGLARTDDGMQLIDEQQDLAVGILHVLQHGLQTFLELAAVFCTGDQRAHIQGKNLLILQTLRHVAAGDPLRQALDDRRLADAGLTDQHRVVLGLSGQNPDHVPDLLITADDRIQLLLLCFADQLLAVFFKRVVGRFRIVADHALIAADGLQRLQEGLPVNAVGLEEFLQLPVRL